jgi:signal transduction histidine kinase
MIRRFLAVIVGLTLLVLIVHDVPLASHLRAVERDRLTTSLERDAFTLAGLAEERLEEYENKATTNVSLLQELSESYGTVAGSEVYIVDGRGFVVAATDRDAVGSDRSARASIELAIDGIRSSEIIDDGREVLDVAVPVLSGPEAIGAVEFVRRASEIDRRTNERLRGIIAAAAISLVLAAVIGWILARTLAQPLRRLRRATAAIAAGDLDARAVVPPGPPEIRALAEDFNSMVERLERVVADQRDFAGDASHQLRTPLTTLRLRIEQTMSSGGLDASQRESLQSAIGELRRLERLVEGLLALARAGADPVTTSVDVSAIAIDRLDAWAALAEENAVTIVTRVAPGIRAVAVLGTVEQVIDNYLDNALEVAPRGSSIEVELRQQSGWVTLDVGDAGPGLRPDEMELAFDRFWRGDHAAEGGSGVGLSVVRRLAEACGGEAALRSNERGGITASLRLRAG